MKKLTRYYICLLVVLLLSGCTTTINGVKTHAVKSYVFTKEEIDTAKLYVIDHFQEHLRNCELLEVYYAGDEMVSENKDVALYYGGDACMLLYTSFMTGDSDMLTLEPNSKYEHYGWFFVRKDGQLELVGLGY